ncbi:MAG: hypothetical protein IPM69_06860 [Ignavibacteria bacterium]|nr:hypothetical protein [Ignavibacteria bacterium]
MTQEAKIKKYDLTLQKYIQNKSFVKILRTIFGNEENLSGFILEMSSDFLFLQLCDDFMFNGYAIIRKDDFLIVLDIQAMSERKERYTKQKDFIKRIRFFTTITIDKLDRNFRDS